MGNDRNPNPPGTPPPFESGPSFNTMDLKLRCLSLAINAAPLLNIPLKEAGTGAALLQQAEMIEKWARGERIDEPASTTGP